MQALSNVSQRQCLQIAAIALLADRLRDDATAENLCSRPLAEATHQAMADAGWTDRLRACAAS
jgi:uncharacterized membrane protein YqiK